MRKLPSVATPKERKWLDRLRRLRWDWGDRVDVTHRNSDEDWDIGNLSLLLKQRKDGTVDYGSICGTHGRWMIAEVKRLEAQERREYKRDTLAHLGAHI